MTGGENDLSSAASGATRSEGSPPRAQKACVSMSMTRSWSYPYCVPAASE